MSAPSEAIQPDVSAYQVKELREHTLLRPDMVVGSVDRRMREELFLDVDTMTIFQGVTDVPPALLRIFVELLSNAQDNAKRSQGRGVDPGEIEVMMSARAVSVRNGGLPIPVVPHMQVPDKTVPEVLFGTMLSGSNFGESCNEAGRNGIGAKATNIFSNRFMVVVEDAANKKKFTQIWSENMSSCSEPEIVPYLRGKSSVLVVYEADFRRFGYPEPSDEEAAGPPRYDPESVKMPPLSEGENAEPGGYPASAFHLFARYCADAAFNVKVPVIFNGVKFAFKDIREYGRLYLGDAVESSIVYYEWPPGVEIKPLAHGIQKAKDPSIHPRVEMLVADTPDSGRAFSFVNGIMTTEGGVHVNAALESVLHPIVKIVNETKSKGKKEAAGAAKAPAKKVTILDAKPHVSLLLSVWVKTPGFGGQTKTKLETFDDGKRRELKAGEPPGWPLHFKVPEDTLRKVEKWDLTDRLRAALQAKFFDLVRESGGKKERYVESKGDDANEAGGPLSAKCLLCTTEGDSGSGYTTTMISNIPRGADFYGCLPLRGKGLNAMNASADLLAENRELKELKKMLGLVDGTDYLDDKNFANLRYGGLLIMADSDVDGKHIVGLVLNFFFCFFPSLLTRGYVMYYRSPILRLTKGKNVHKFYTMSEFETWKAITPDYNSWKAEYYKGLGSSEAPEVIDDLRAPRIVKCFFDDRAPEALTLAFNKRMADQRKKWLEEFSLSRGLAQGVEQMDYQPISLFIDYEMIQHSQANVERSIPRLEDGLKLSQRQIFFTAYETWKVPTNKGKYDPKKVAQFGPLVASETNYQHGEDNLQGTIIRMAAQFVGSNNMSYFYPKGQFGTRKRGYRDAANGRYIHTYPEWWIHLVYRPEDLPLLKRRVEENEEVEPEVLYPIIPTVLINGVNGIGTAHSTFIPNHKVLDILAHLRAIIAGVPAAERPPVEPWWRGFKGSTEMIDRRLKPRRGESSTSALVKLVAATSEGELSQRGAARLADDPEITLPDTLPLLHEHSLEDLEEAEKAEAEAARAEAEMLATTRPRMSVLTKGVFEAQGDRIVITELPVGVWSKPYEEFLEKLRKAKMISGYNNHSTIYESRFELFKPAFTPNHQTLRLTKSYTLSNMVLLGPDNKPKRYDSVPQIIEDFYNIRLPLYVKRQALEIARLEEKATRLALKARFIQAVLDKRIVVEKRKQVDLAPEMEALGFPMDLLDIAYKSFTYEEIERLNKQREELLAELERFRALAPTDIWLDEIAEFEKAYLKRLEKDDARMAPDSALMGSPAPKSTKSRGRPSKK